MKKDTRDTSQGELVINDGSTGVLIGLTNDQLRAVREWADGCGMSVPKLLKDILLKEIHYYEYQANIKDGSDRG
jgi:hypothetical protein